MSPQELSNRLQTLSPDAQVEVTDLTGTQDHYQAVIVSEVFEGKMTLEQHRMVMALVQEEIDSGEVHALTLRTLTPKQTRSK